MLDRIGFMYSRGDGVEQDYGAASRWFGRAADKGDALAQFNLGQLYLEGRGVGQDFAAAAKWFRMAAEQGDSDAQYRLGQLYVNGDGVDEDAAQAYVWTTLAASQGHEAASVSYESISSKLTPEQVEAAEKEARVWRAKWQ